jgi:hydroxyacyl-ACP dehydratase HTD2-like protein with hotdog domain
VHGPLSLTVMLSVLQSQLGNRAEQKEVEYVDCINYRHLAPLYVGKEMRVCVAPQPQGNGQEENESEGARTRKWDVWVENHNGGLSVRGLALTKTMPA